MGRLSCFHHQRLGCHSCGQLPQPSRLGGPAQALHLAPREWGQQPPSAPPRWQHPAPSVAALPPGPHALEVPCHLLIHLRGQWHLYSMRFPLGLLTVRCLPPLLSGQLGLRQQLPAPTGQTSTGSGTYTGAVSPAVEGLLLSSSSSSSISGSTTGTPPPSSRPHSASHTYWRSRDYDTLIPSLMGSVICHARPRAPAPPHTSAPPRPLHLGHGHVPSPSMLSLKTRALGWGIT